MQSRRIKQESQLVPGRPPPGGSPPHCPCTRLPAAAARRERDSRVPRAVAPPPGDDLSPPPALLPAFLFLPVPLSLGFLPPLTATITTGSPRPQNKRPQLWASCVQLHASHPGLESPPRVSWWPLCPCTGCSLCLERPFPTPRPVTLCLL